MSANVSIESNVLIINIKGLHKLLGFKSSFKIPLKHIVNVYTDAHDASAIFKGLKFPGVNIPGLIVVGTFYQDRQKIYCDACDFNKTVTIELKDEAYVKIIVEVDDPDKVLRLIHSALNDA